MVPASQKPSAQTVRSLAKNLLLSAVALILTVVALLAISYVGLRHLDRAWMERTEKALKPSIPHFFDYLDIKLDFIHPYLKIKIVPNQLFPFCRINGQGYRGLDFVRGKTGAFRVAIVGGSTAMSWFANSEGETIHERLKAELEKDFPDERFEVYNFAVFSYNSTQELFLLETEVLDYSPDFVIILSGINDFGWAIQGRWSPRQPLGWFHMRSILDPRHFQEGYAKKPWLLRNSFRWSFLARTAWENARIRCSPIRFLQRLVGGDEKTAGSFSYQERDFALIGERTRIWATNIELMARLLDSYGIDYCASLQPCAFYRRKPSAEEVRVATIFIKGRKDLDTAKRYLKTVYPAAERALLKERSFAVRYLDLTRLFENVDEAVYFDLCHLNARGTEILARRYADHLRPYVEKWLRSRQRTGSPTPPPGER